MDPTANLAEQIRIARHLVDCDRDEAAPLARCALPHLHNAARLADLILALDRWIVRGGHLPDEWVR